VAIFSFLFNSLDLLVLLYQDKRTLAVSAQEVNQKVTGSKPEVNRKSVPKQVAGATD